MGDEIPCIPNKKEGGFCFGGKIAPIFFNTLEDSGAFPVECDVSKLNMGQEIIFEPFNGKILDADSGEVLSTFELKTPVFLMRFEQMVEFLNYWKATNRQNKRSAWFRAN